MLGFAPLGAIPLGGTVPIQAAVTADEAVRRRGGPAPGSYKTYLPPGRWTKKRDELTTDDVRELYAEAKREIPRDEQNGLLPLSLRLTARGSRYLPPERHVDFEKLVRDFEALGKLIAALERIEAEKERRRRRRRRDEETFMFLLNMIDDD